MTNPLTPCKTQPARFGYGVLFAATAVTSSLAEGPAVARLPT